VLWNYKTTQKTGKGAERQTTNNRMEMTAVIMALETLTRECHVRILTDSQYVMRGMQEWLAGWKKRGWKTAAKKPVKNQDLWQALDEVAQKHEVSWRWVKGHSGHELNDEADALANRGIDELDG
jgi:ribonuclease HI